MLKWFILLPVMALMLIGCSVCRDYEAIVIEYGQMIVDYNKSYISKDTNISESDKAIMLKACDEYLLLLKKH